MKSRNGFVSNSSSSSFICIGVTSYDINEVMKYLGYTEEEAKNIILRENEKDGINEWFYGNTDHPKKYSVQYDYNSELYYIGIDPNLKDLVELTQDTLDKMEIDFGEKPEFIVNCTYDG